MPSSASRSKTPPRLVGLRGRADLISALAAGDWETAQSIAELADLEWVPRPPEADRAGRRALSETLGAGTEEPEPPAELSGQTLWPVLFWRVQALQPIAPAPQPEDKRSAPRSRRYSGWVTRPRIAPAIPPLAEWRELEPRLRRLLCLPQLGRAPDLELAVHRISRSQFVARVPRERRRRWGPVLYLIEDRANRLAPYRLDQYAVYQSLRALIPDHTLRRLVLHAGDDPASALRAAAPDGHGLPPPGSQVLVLGDLGCLAPEPARRIDIWKCLGVDLRAAGCLPVALVPAPVERCPRILARTWDLVLWERPRPRALDDDLGARAWRLLCLVSPAVRIEPGLLRAARLLLPPNAADAGTESDAWQHPYLQSGSPAGAMLSPAQAQMLRAAFGETVSPDLQLRFAYLLRSWRGHLPEEIWFEELLNFPQALRAHPALSADQALARRYYAEFAHQAEGAVDRLPGADRDWFGRVERRAGPALWGDDAVGELLASLSWKLHEDDPDYQPPSCSIRKRSNGRMRRFVVSSFANAAMRCVWWHRQPRIMSLGETARSPRSGPRTV
jgi:hypothetical protein